MAKYSLIYDSTMTIQNIVNIDPDNLPTPQEGMKYVPYFGGSKGDCYGWTSEAMTTRAMPGDCETIINNIVVFSESAKREEIRDAKYAEIKARRKEIQYGFAYCLSNETNYHILMDADNRGVITDGLQSINDWGTDVANEFPQLKVKTGDASWMILPPADVSGIAKCVKFVTEALFQSEETIQGILEPSTPGSIEYDFDSSMTLQDFENKDYVVIFDSLMTVAKYQNTNLYAQPDAYQP